MKVFYIENGKYYEADNSLLKNSEVMEVVKELLENTIDELRLFVDDERMKNLFNSETGIEILLKDSIEITSEKLGKIQFKKIYFPLSGDFIGDESSPVVTIFLGDPEYESGPLRNPDGFEQLKKLEVLVKHSLRQ